MTNEDLSKIYPFKNNTNENEVINQFQNETNYLQSKRKYSTLMEKSLDFSKFRIDSINKKVKAKFFTMLNQNLSVFLNKKLPKLPQKIVTNV